MDTLSNAAIAEAGLADWRKLAQPVFARFLGSDPDALITFAGRAARTAGEHLADLHVRPDAVEVSLATRRDGVWVTRDDLDLAAAISELAAEHGLTSDPAGVTQLEVGLDTADSSRVARFWSALLTGSPDNVLHDSVLDPRGLVPPIWFQPTDEHEVPRQRWHFDLWLAPETAEERIAVAVAAGGTVVDDSEAPAFWVLADADGNKACICTSLEREPE